MNPSVLNTQLQPGLQKLRIIVSDGRVEACPRNEGGYPTSGSSQIQTYAGYRFAPRVRSHTNLTPRETETLKFIAEGLTNPRIAIEMKISIKTVEKHRQCIMNKLGRHDTAALTRYAVGRGILFDEEFRRVLIERLHRQSSPWRTKMITSRETEVLRLVAGGLVNKQIASELNISIKTVGNHRQALMDRLNIHEVAGLTRYAISERLIPNHAPAAPGYHTTRPFPTATV